MKRQTMYLDVSYISRCIGKAMYLKKPKRLAIWNGGSSSFVCRKQTHSRITSVEILQIVT